MNPWRYHALGANRLALGATEVALARRTAALVVYLALEGPRPRSKLAGLLWPDAVEATARNNLAQALRRLKGTAGTALVVTGPVLELTPTLAVDAAELKAAALAGRAAEVAAASGELLPHFDFDDAPEFADWLWSTREEFGALRRDALDSLITNLEAQGYFKEALSYAERLLELEPISETAHRYVMRLHYALGDRPAALKTYARCEAVLAREVGVEPLPETQDLARRIEQGILRTAATKPQALPLEALRPPRLVGREHEWARMEEAWQRGQLIILSGEPGIGKSRLAADFAANKGRAFYLGARPGDGVVPRSSMVRSVRRMLAEHPDIVLEPWVRCALLPLMPELATDKTTETMPEKPGTAGASVPEALLRVMQLGSREVDVFVYDDMQFADSVSLEEGFYFFSSAFPLGAASGIPRWVLCYRREELGGAAVNLLGNLIAAGHAIHIELEPLAGGSIEDMLTGLNVSSHTLGGQLERFTGGNPLYILETVRHLLETGRLDEGVAERLPLPGKVRSIVRRRLERLSPTALRIAQTAAVLQSDFDPALVGEMLNLDALALLEPWEELERAQVLTVSRFTHDLIYEAVLIDTSPSVAVLLHRRAAEVLSAKRSSPLRVAKHWLGAGDKDEAVKVLLEAAELAATEDRTEDAAELHLQASNLQRGGEAASERVAAARAHL